MEFNYSRRVESLRERIELEGLKAAVVFGESNLIYYVGTEAANALVVSSDQNIVVLSSSLNYIRALDERKIGDLYFYSEYMEGEERRGIKGDLYSALRTVLEEIGVRKGEIGVNLGSLGYEDYSKLVKALGFEPKDISGIVSRSRSLKDPEELKAIEKSISISQEAMRKALDSLDKGVKEIEVLRVIEDVFRSRGAYNAFTPIVAFGDHTAQPHATPGGRELKEGDLVIIDLGAKLAGYCSDMTRTLVYGKPSSKQVKLFKSVLKAQAKAIESIRAGIKASEVDKAAREALKEEGLSTYFIHGTGHGVGIDIHEVPYITLTSKDDLVAGMVTTIEPGVYIRGYGGVRIEDVVLVRPGDAEVLTSFEREMF